VRVKTRGKQGRDRVLGPTGRFVDAMFSVELMATLHNMAVNNVLEFKVIIAARSNTKPKTAGCELAVDKIKVLCRQGVSRGQNAINERASLGSGRYRVATPFMSFGLDFGALNAYSL
jgi:hypothetical protein